jgi:hypothetical protein
VHGFGPVSNLCCLRNFPPVPSLPRFHLPRPARISHQLIAALWSVGLLDVLSSMPAELSVARLVSMPV